MNAGRSSRSPGGANTRSRSPTGARAPSSPTATPSSSGAGAAATDGLASGSAAAGAQLSRRHQEEREMPHYRRIGEIPRKRHTVLRGDDGNIRGEELLGHAGFT